MPDLITTLTEERAQVADAIGALVAQDDYSPEEFAELQTRGERLDVKIDNLRIAAEQRARADQRWEDMRRAPRAAETRATADIGDLMLRSDPYKMFLRNGAGGRAHLMSVDMQRRALITASFLPGEAAEVVGTPPQARTPFLDLIRNVQVDALTVPIVSHPDAAPLAGVVAEGAQKPEATINTSEWTVTLETIAHWVEVTRQALADNSLVRDIITGSLMRGVLAKAEAQAAAIITGGTYSTVAGADMLESIRLGLAEVQAQGYQPNGVLINPADAASLDMAIWQVAAQVPTTSSSLFGLRLVATPTVAAGSAYVGDWQNGAMWFYRSNAELYVTDSDVGIVATAPVSNFKRNVLTFLAEITAKAAVIQGEAIAKCTPTGGAVTATRTAPKAAGK